MKRLKFDNETIRIVTKLVCYHDYRMEATPANVRRAMNRIGVELFPYYLAVRLSDAKSQSTYMRREKIENIVEIRNLYKQILMENQCVTLRQLAVSGRELMELGMKPGRELGAMLSELLEYVLDDPERNTKENLCKYVKEKMEKEKVGNAGRKKRILRLSLSYIRKKSLSVAVKTDSKKSGNWKRITIQVNGTGGSHERI